MRKKTSILLILPFLVFPLLVLADHDPGPVVPTTPMITCPSQDCPEGAVCIPNPICAETFEELISSIIKFIFWLAVALAPLMVLIGAFYILTAGGDPNRVETGKKIILYAVIGLAVILFARGLIAIIEAVLGVAN